MFQVAEVETRTGMFCAAKPFVAGAGKDVTLDASAAVLEVEEQVHQKSLPAPVATALHNASSGGKLVEIESLTRGRVVVS